MTPYWFAIAANICFGTASIPFARFALSHSPRWMNQLKVSIAMIGFVIAFFLLEQFVQLPWSGHAYLLVSGFIGLCAGDLFLFKAFASLGPARTLVLYSFQPFLLGIYGYFFLNQHLNLYQLTAIFCMVLCVFTFVLERNHLTGKPDLKNFSYAFIGIFLDALGVMLSRQAYEIDSTLGSFQVNATRGLGALIGFFILSPASYGLLTKDLIKMKSMDRNIAIGAAFLGTFVSLSFYLKALKNAHIASLTAISITLPIWVSLIEHVKKREFPNRYLWFAFLLFMIGFVLMNFPLDFSR